MFRVLALSLGLVATSVLPGPAAAAGGCPDALRFIATTPIAPISLPSVDQLLKTEVPASVETIFFGDSHIGHLDMAEFGGIGDTDKPLLLYGSGDGFPQALWRLTTLEPKLRQLSPRRVVMILGTNNISFPSCGIELGYVTVLNKLHALWPKAEIYASSVMPTGVYFDDNDANRLQTNEWLRNNASALKFYFIQLNDADLTCGNHGVVERPKLDDGVKRPDVCTPKAERPVCANYNDDRIHLSEDGYKLVSRSIAHAIAP